MERHNRQMQRTEATRAKLLAVARELFVRDGFASVPAEEIVREAGLTRGALYHQFGGKEGLFAELYTLVQEEINARIGEAAATERTAWDAVRAGCHAFLRACIDPVVQRIVLLDAPTVLSWERWREVDAQYGFGSLKAGLLAAQQAGDLNLDSVDALSHLLVGAMNEGAMWIARSPDPEQALQDAIETLDQLLMGVRVTVDQQVRQGP